MNENDKWFVGIIVALVLIVVVLTMSGWSLGGGDGRTGPRTGPRYDPLGPDRDCSDFATRPEAMIFYEAAGGPEMDPHRLDRDRDGIPCEALP